MNSKDRNMFYEASGFASPGVPGMNFNQYSSFGPGETNANMMPGMNMPNMGQFNIMEKLDAMERQIKKLEQRMSKLENPYDVKPGENVTIQPSFNIM